MGTPFLNASPVEIILKNRDQRVNISLFDTNNDPVDATALTLQVLDTSETELFTEDFIAAPVRIIKPGSTTGEYYMNYGDPAAAANTPDQTETDTDEDHWFIWRAVGTAGTEPSTILQVVRILPPKVFAFLPRFRLQIDKAIKIVDEATNCFLGYSDGMLLEYLEGGLNSINTYQPNTNMILRDFPFDTHGQLLIDVATLVALNSQTLFAVDTDLRYSDQGYSFDIAHVQPLQSFMSSLTQRVDKLVPLFKLNFATMGSIHIVANTSFRLLSLIQAAPQGALFRGLFSGG